MQEKPRSALAIFQALVNQLQAPVEGLLLKQVSQVEVARLNPAPPGGALLQEDAVQA